MATPIYNDIKDFKGIKGLNRLKGWNELSQEEKSSWLNEHPQIDTSKIAPAKMPLVYRNNNYYDTFGPEVYNSTDLNTLGQMYKDSVITNATKEYYGDDKNYQNVISTFLPETQKELLESGYLNDKDYEKFTNENYDVYAEQQKKRNKWNPFEPGENINQEVEDKESWVNNKFGKVRNNYIEQLIAKDEDRKRQESEDEITALTNFYKNAQSAWSNASTAFNRGDTDTDDIIDYMSSNALMTKEQANNLKSRPEEQKVDLLSKIISNSDFAPGAVNSLFEQIALPREMREKTPFGDEEVTYQLPGSRTYNALKDSDKFKNFTDSDKLREYATWQVLASKYGTNSAIMGLEATMLKYAKDNETAGDWWSDVGTNIVLGGVANIMNKVNAVNNIYVESTEGREALANLLEGKNTDGSERRQRTNGDWYDWFVDNWNNPYYWSKVDQYNTLDPLEIADIDSKGGISPHTTIQTPEAPKFFSTDTLKEALKMNKFIWSDYLTSRLLGGVAGGLTKGASLISPKFGNAVGFLGSLGTVAASGMGIAESYGIMTYEQTYQNMMENLDKKRDSYIDQEVQDLLRQPENQEQIDAVVKDMMQQQQRANAGKENPLTISESDIRKQVEADFINYHTQRLNNRNTEIESRNQDEYFARRAAANAYIVDATIEEIRMSLVNFTFKKYLFDKGTRKALGDNKNYATPESTPTGELTEGNKYWNRTKAVLKPVWGGFESNYFDDVTVGLGKGFGLEQYNSYLQDKYDANKNIESGKYSFAFLDGLKGGLQGAEEALYDRQSFYDGFIGALGTPLSGMPRLSSSDRSSTMQRMGVKEGDKLTAGEKINKWVVNPLLDAYYEAKGNETRTKEALPAVNQVLRDKKEALENMNDLIIGLNKVAEANASDSDLTRKDAKERQAFDLLYDMEGVSTSPIITESPLVQNAAETIDRIASGDISDGEIQEFLGQPENKGIRSYADAETITKQRIRKNAQSLQKMAKNISRAKEIIENSTIGQDISPDLKRQFVFQLAMNDAWTDRQSEVEHSITGSNKVSNGHNAVAKYGNKREFDRQYNALLSEKARLIPQITLGKVATDATKEMYELAKESNDAEKIENAKREWLKEQMLLQRYHETVRNLDAEIKQMKKESSLFDEKAEVPVLTASQILSLNPEERATILNNKNKNNYSKEQQIEIDKALADVRMRTTDAERLISDSGRLYRRIQDNKAAYNRMLSNPDAAAAYASTIQESRFRRLNDVLNERKIEDVYRIFDNSTSDEELLNNAKQALNSKDYNLRGKHIDAYIKDHPDKGNILKGLSEVAKIREDAAGAIKEIIPDANQSDIVAQFKELTDDANNGNEAMSALEGLIDIQTDATAKLQLDRVLDRMKSLGHQRDATKLRDRELERQRKQEAETKRLEEEAKKDGKNYDWDGYKVGDTVYNKDTGTQAVVEGFEKSKDGSNKMVLAVKMQDGKTGRFRYDSVTGKDKITKEKPAPKQETSNEAPAGAQQVFDDTTTSNHQEAVAEQIDAEDVIFDTDSEGNPQSPTAEQQAAANKSPIIAIPKVDPTDQGNEIQESDDLINGNRYVTYSINDLRNGIVTEELPESDTSLYGVLYNWLKNNKIQLQEIIDEEFGRMLVDNPDIDIRFMKVKTNDSTLQSMLFNVVELTPEAKNKYHKDSRGGVIQANGKSWLIVGISGFDKTDPQSKRNDFDVMRGPINKRSKTYFEQNGDEQYYVDNVAHSKVQNTTSGRVVNQNLNQEAPRLKRVSELIKSAGLTLRQVSFGVQTKKVGEGSFATTKNIKDKSKVFPPRNIEDNRGRSFILLDTPNGYKIPGMIEPAMYNNLADDSPLKQMIDSTIVKLFSPSAEERNKNIRELCEFLVFTDDKKIIVTKDNKTIIIKNKNMPNIVQSLGKDFDMAKFFKDFRNADFRINVTLKTFEDPKLFRLYDESDALMTTIDSMRTVGMSYTIYMTDENGQPIIKVPVNNPEGRVNRTEFKTYQTVVINNAPYAFRNGKFVNRRTNEVVAPGSALELSCIYNRAIKEGNWVPLDIRNGKEYYSVIKEGNDIVVERDGLGNIKELSQEASNEIKLGIQTKIDNKTRLENLEDVNLDDTPVKTSTKTEETPITPEQVAQQAIGNFEAPKEEVKQQPQKEVVQEAKESQPQETKEVISGIGKKSLTELQSTENLSTFADVASSIKYSDSLYEVLEEKNWGITGDVTKDAQILKEHNVSIVGITNVEDWINLIRNCK